MTQKAKIPTEAEKRDLFERLNKRIVYLALKHINTAENFETFAKILFDEYYLICSEYPAAFYKWIVKALYSNTLAIRNIALDKFNRGEDVAARIEKYLDYDTSKLIV